MFDGTKNIKLTVNIEEFLQSGVFIKTVRYMKRDKTTMKIFSLDTGLLSLLLFCCCCFFGGGFLPLV